MVRHQYLQAQGARLVHALETGDAVVHRDQKVGAAVLDALRNRCRQAIAIDDAVGHDVADVFCTEQTQAAHADGAGGGAVAVVVGDDAEFFVGRDGVGQQARRSAGAEQGVGRQQARQTLVEFERALHAARREQLRQQRVHAALFQRPGAARWHITLNQFHSVSSTVAARRDSNRPSKRLNAD